MNPTAPESDRQEKRVAGEDNLRFGFGDNWADYIAKHYSEERVAISRRHLLAFLKLDGLAGKTFLDIGCGSGLHSLAAWQAGAERVVSFDFDPMSVATTAKLRGICGNPENWQVMQGSVLDDGFVRGLPKSDIVYSWGVLHHTGSMWRALSNAAGCIADTGVFYVALYSRDVYVDPDSDYWLRIKRAYNAAGRLRKTWMASMYIARDLLYQCLILRKNPLAHVIEYKKSRGMSYLHDVRDWLGGWPMEFAGNKETENFANSELGLELLHAKAGEANTEYLFRRRGAANYWDQVAFSAPLLDLIGPFQHVGEHAWRAAIPGYPAAATGSEGFILYENGSPVGWLGAPLDMIIRWGKGRYRIDDQALIFSATDNSDPNGSGKKYQFRTNFA